MFARLATELALMLPVLAVALPLIAGGIACGLRARMTWAHRLAWFSVVASVVVAVLLGWARSQTTEPSGPGRLRLVADATNCWLILLVSLGFLLALNCELRSRRSPVRSGVLLLWQAALVWLLLAPSIKLLVATLVAVQVLPLVYLVVSGKTSGGDLRRLAVRQLLVAGMLVWGVSCFAVGTEVGEDDAVRGPGSESARLVARSADRESTADRRPWAEMRGWLFFLLLMGAAAQASVFGLHWGWQSIERQPPAFRLLYGGLQSVVGVDIGLRLLVPLFPASSQAVALDVCSVGGGLAVLAALRVWGTRGTRECGYRTTCHLMTLAWIGVFCGHDGGRLGALLLLLAQLAGWSGLISDRRSPGDRSRLVVLLSFAWLPGGPGLPAGILIAVAVLQVAGSGPAVVLLMSMALVCGAWGLESRAIPRPADRASGSTDRRPLPAFALIAIITVAVGVYPQAAIRWLEPTDPSPGATAAPPEEAGAGRDGWHAAGRRM